jgi:hypothetical protein
LLKEFSKLPLEQRYRKHGYGEMLKLFLKIEDRAEIEALEPFHRDDVKVVYEVSEGSYAVYTGKKVPQSAMYASLTLMSDVRNGIKDTSKTVVIKKIVKDKGYLTIVSCDPKKALSFPDTSLRYRLQYLPNSISSMMANKALDHIKIRGYENYMLTFDQQNISHRRSCFEEFEDADIMYENENISTNEPQKLCLKSIVNRTSYPAPFCLFGGPGSGKTSLAVETVCGAKNFVFIMSILKILCLFY